MNRKEAMMGIWSKILGSTRKGKTSKYSSKKKLPGAPIIICSRCRRTEADIEREIDDAEKRGPTLIAGFCGILLCQNCKRYYCWHCLRDNGSKLICPNCEKPAN
jgi:hypothetical protein